MFQAIQGSIKRKSLKTLLYQGFKTLFGSLKSIQIERINVPGGNYILKLIQDPNTISFYDIYMAIIEDANLPSASQVTHYKRTLQSILKETEQAFINVLKQHYLVELIDY